MCNKEALIRPMQKVATNKRIQAAQHMDGVDNILNEAGIGIVLHEREVAWRI